MTNGFRPYLSMKDSGVSWILEIPAHWSVSRLKNWLRINQAVLSEDTDPDFEFEYLDIGTVGTGRLVTQPRKVRFGRSPSRARRVVRRGDTIISTVRTYLKAVWHAEDPHPDLIASTGFAVLSPPANASPNYLSFLCQSEGFTDQITAASVGIAYPAIAETKFAGFCVPVPPLSEQTAIAHFLDHIDRRIQKYIRAKEKQIELLDEYKQALIHQAVTGQIDIRTGEPYPEYKESGVEWLPTIPAHWEMQRSKRVYRPRKELAEPDDTQLSATQAFGVIGQKDYEERIGRKIVRISLHLEKRRHVEPDDFVISMRSFQGGLERAWVRGCIRSSYVVLRPATEVVVPFFGFLFKSVGYISALQATANFIRDGQDLNFENFCRVDVPFPPLEDQRRIAQLLDREVKAISSTIDHTVCNIRLLQEYRTRLIADVVTGKLDVREAAAALPDRAAIAWENGVDTIQAESHSHRAGHSSAEEANA